jgi:hypothetical protein
MGLARHPSCMDSAAVFVDVVLKERQARLQSESRNKVKKNRMKHD